MVVQPVRQPGIPLNCVAKLMAVYVSNGAIGIAAIAGSGPGFEGGFFSCALTVFSAVRCSRGDLMRYRIYNGFTYEEIIPPGSNAIPESITYTTSAVARLPS